MDMAILLHDGLTRTYPTSICHVHPHDTTRSPAEYAWATLAPGASAGVVVGLLLRSVRVFGQFSWLQAGSVKAALSRPGRPPGWCPIPPTSTPKGHNASRWALVQGLVKPTPLPFTKDE